MFGSWRRNFLMRSSRPRGMHFLRSLTLMLHLHHPSTREEKSIDRKIASVRYKHESRCAWAARIRIHMFCIPFSMSRISAAFILVSNSTYSCSHSILFCSLMFLPPQADHAHPRGTVNKRVAAARCRSAKEGTFPIHMHLPPAPSAHTHIHLCAWSVCDTIPLFFLSLFLICFSWYFNTFG